MAHVPFNPSADSTHMIVRQLFSRLVFSLQMESSLSMLIISYWLWLEGNGHADYLAFVDSFNNYRLQEIALAGKMVLEDLYLKSSQNSNHRSVQGDCFHREAVKGISFYLNNICHKALADILQIAEAEQHIDHRNQVQQENMKGKAPMSMMDHLFQMDHEEGTSFQSTPTPKNHIHKDIDNPTSDQCLSTYPLATLFDSLNLKEEPSDPIQIQQRSSLPRDERTIFVSFSNSYPFTKDELYDFFMWNFGDVEVVSMEEPIESRPPLYAHITFSTQETVFRVVGRNGMVKSFSFLPAGYSSLDWVHISMDGFNVQLTNDFGY
ncbi:hypothetical protein U9M48_012418 [Paspalum notatum var. saurae]|uniref:RRM domain-containing protein n=1 Tax=Paspalum notatum var. saurae TaxID=547442 RepID=A0AAQ3SXW4_PASNO